MKLSRHAVTLVAALLLAATAPKLYAQTTRIAVVDLQRALNETEDGRRAKARLKRLFKQRQQSLDKSQNELKALKEQIEQQVKAGVAEKVLQERAAEYQKALIELQSKYMEYQRELAEQEAALTREIIARMERILRRIGQSDGYTLIVERNEGGVVWVPSNLDLTDQVIQRYNAGEGRDGETAPAPAPAGEGGGGGGGTGPRRPRPAPTKAR
jgi:outer membrane protein